MDEARRQAALTMYELAWGRCVTQGGRWFLESVDWFRTLGPPSQVSDEMLYQEYCWVVINGGLSERVARVIYQRLQRIFIRRPLEWIARRRHRILPRALRFFRHRGKVEAMLWMAQHLTENPGAGERLKAMGPAGAIEHLGTLPWVGRITRYHLARNIGIDCVKPDVHMQRLVGLFRCSPHDLCAAISEANGERLGVVDYVLWQWCAYVGQREYAAVVSGLVPPAA